jgi:hypothetical protein
MSYTEAEYEQVKELLLNHRGKGNEISSREINDQVVLDDVGSFPQTRKCVRDIMEQEGIPVIGGGNGYYVAETEEEIESALSTLESRIINTTERKMFLKRAARNWEDQIVPSDDSDIL